MLRVTADANYRARREEVNQRRVTPEVAGGFLPGETKSFTRPDPCCLRGYRGRGGPPRVTLLFTGPAPCYRVIYGVIGVQLLQFAGESVGVGGGELTRSRPLARPSRAFAFSQIPFVVSQTTQVRFAESADGVEHVQRPAPNSDRHREQALSGFDPLEFFADFGCAPGFSRRNLGLVFSPKSDNFYPWRFRSPLTLKPLWNWPVTTSWKTARLRAKSPSSKAWLHSVNRSANAKANCARRLRLGFLSG